MRTSLATPTSLGRLTSLETPGIVTSEGRAHRASSRGSLWSASLMLHSVASLSLRESGIVFLSLRMLYLQLYSRSSYSDLLTTLNLKKSGDYKKQVEFEKGQENDCRIKLAKLTKLE